MTYEEALQYLNDLAPRGWRLGLDRMQEFVQRAELAPFLGCSGTPHFIHVAGTNGKGSVTAFVQSMLISAGFRTGAFFSPYVVDPRERVFFGRDMIPEGEFADAIRRLKMVAETLEGTEFGGVTEFEMKTAVGFDHWRRHDAEWVALEVGLGGRFDATNVVTPRASVIVSIGLDHVSILGDTLEKIAFEKAGIIKPGVPVVVGQIAEGAREVIFQVARDAGSDVWSFGEEICVQSVSNGEWRVTTPLSTVLLRPSLYGDVQAHNSALAYAALEISGAGSGQAVADGAQHAGIPGRFQKLNAYGREIILDGAHNAEAARNLRSMLDAYLGPHEPLTMVAGMVSGHEPAEFFHAFQGLVGTVHLAPIAFHRAVPTSELAAAVKDAFPCVYAHETLDSALQAATASRGPILVTGSFYLVGDVLRRLAMID